MVFHHKLRHCRCTLLMTWEGTGKVPPGHKGTGMCSPAMEPPLSAAGNMEATLLALRALVAEIQGQTKAGGGHRWRDSSTVFTFPFLLSFLCFIKGKLCYLF